MNCSNCGSLLTEETVCPHCKAPTEVVTEVSAYIPPTSPEPLTQMSYGVPQAIQKWNCGAFSFNIFWGIGNKCYLPLLCLIPWFGFIWIFVCGAKGNEWAWKSGNYRPGDLNKFLAIQNSWNRGGLANFILGIISFVLILLVMVFAFVVLAATAPILSNNYSF